jgi:hypothetical protein
MQYLFNTGDISQSLPLNKYLKFIANPLVSKKSSR